MLDSHKRDELTESIERAQISAVHRALDQAWWLGYDEGSAQEQRKVMETELTSTKADNENLLILIANLIILGFMLKLYTEVFKDKAIDRRSR